MTLQEFNLKYKDNIEESFEMKGFYSVKTGFAIVENGIQQEKRMVEKFCLLRR